jgi:NTE family protein
MTAVKRALVLGGGGVIGVAWEMGIAAGMADAGIDLRESDVFVGTSAGAIVGAQLAAGFLPHLPRPRSVPPPPPGGAVDRSSLDFTILGSVFKLWGTMTHADREVAAQIGKLTATLPRNAQLGWADRVIYGMGLEGWPERPLLVSAVDTETGERRVFDRSSGADIDAVVIASSAVPGMFPPVEIEGRLYMDGQVHSSTNADVLLAFKPEQVLIAMPTNRVTGSGIGPHAENMLERELSALREAGCAISLRMPQPEDREKLGSNLMDPKHATDAFTLGVTTGKAWAKELAG